MLVVCFMFAFSCVCEDVDPPRMHPKMFVLIIKSMFFLKYNIFLETHPNLSMFVSIILGGRAKAGGGTHFSPPTNHSIHDTSQKTLFFC
jgi:hypothetical protein